MSPRESKYKKLVTNLLGREISIDDGISEAILISFEIDKDLNLPYALREYYRLLGNLTTINKAHNELLHLNDIYIEDNKLIFMLENQGVCYWGIDLKDLAMEDPPIYEGFTVSESDLLEWRIHSSKCPDFLVAMFYWQAALGGLSYGGIADLDLAAFKKIDSEYNFIIEDGGVKIYDRSGVSICVCSGFQNNLELFVGCNNKNSFLEIEKELDLDWSYSDI